MKPDLEGTVLSVLLRGAFPEPALCDGSGFPERPVSGGYPGMRHRQPTGRTRRADVSIPPLFELRRAHLAACLVAAFLCGWLFADLRARVQLAAGLITSAFIDGALHRETRITNK